jgi:hypothetical protein
VLSRLSLKLTGASFLQLDPSACPRQSRVGNGSILTNLRRRREREHPIGFRSRIKLHGAAKVTLPDCCLAIARVLRANALSVDIHNPVVPPDDVEFQIGEAGCAGADGK